MLNVTDSALDEIREFVRHELAPGEIVRIQRCASCGGPNFELAVDNPMPNDITLDFNDVKLTVSPVMLDLLDEVTLDYTDDGYFDFL